MKIHVEINHGWCGQQVSCHNCGYEFVLVRERKFPPANNWCPKCKKKDLIIEEYPWTGMMEVETDD